MWKKTKRKLADLIRSASFTEVGVALDYSANWQTREERTQVFGTQNIVQTIPVTQPRQMIHQLRQVEHALRLSGDLRVAEHFTEGEYVKVESGPLRGLEGRVLQVGHSASIVLSVDILGQAIKATVDLRDVKHMER